MLENVEKVHTWLPHRVSYGETDTMGYLYYAEYLHIFERSRSELIRSCGLSYAEFEKRGFMLPVREASCRYRNPARYDDLIQVYVELDKLGRASMLFTYKVYDESRTVLLCTGMTEHACTNLNGRPTGIPDWFKEIFTVI